MKKIIFTLLALVGTMSMNAQIMQIYNGETLVKEYKASEATHVVFKEVPVFSFGQGEAVAKGIGSVKWIQLWENGPKFAEYNVGATYATEYGGYYTWGGTYNNNPNLEGFEWTDDHNTGTTSLTGNDDTATALWGSNWRMPTSTELENLLKSDNCKVEWKSDYKGKAGYLCTGKEGTAYENNSVFLPAAGLCDDGDVHGHGQGNYGLYWSSTPNGMYNVYYLFFNSGDQGVNFDRRNFGYSIRAVLNEVVE